MIEVKIPSPSIDTFKEYIASKGLTTDVALDIYMTILARSVYNISGNYLRYGHECLTKNGVMATINLSRLQSYSVTSKLFEHIGFERAIISRIAVANKHYGNDCPLASPDHLNAHISQWPTRWITIYLWMILSVDRLAKDNSGQTCLMRDKQLMSALMAELECFDGPTRKQVMDSEASELAGTALDPKHLATIVAQIMNQTEDLACRSQSMSFEDRIREKQEIQTDATSKLIRILGGIMHLAKTDDNYFGADRRNNH